MARSQSSTLDIPEAGRIPRHIALIMDGNGRWARQRLLPRIAGHRRGSEAVRALVESAARLGVEYLTLFAFSSENWRRPPEEVSMLMQLFISILESEISRLHQANIRVRIIGDLARLGPRIETLIAEAHALTRDNTRLTLTVAVNYGGRWDILQGMNALLHAHPEKAAGDITESDLTPFLAMGEAPEPDLFIRTGGEQRISNFLLWQLAYTELYFTETLWPDFDAESLNAAIRSYQQRERRFGRTSEQCYAPES
ncbi:MAG: di-trans,poly-cis-decaprenylcistransferase [Betaproteobacteria bacterium]|nr:di-trans,poly-cis-decaprenylcistransferase [Betaproteobacteria bacterium]